MARTPLLHRFRKLAQDHLAAAGQGLSPAQLRQQSQLKRRDFLKYAATMTAAATLPNATLASAKGREAEIVIIGSGIAGLNAALTLQDAGLAATIYDSDDRIGGRIHSLTDYWQHGQVTEWCGEFIDSGHTTMQSLAQRFDLPLDDLLAAEPAAATDTYYFFGDYYSADQADQDFAPVLATLINQNQAAGYPAVYNAYTPAARELDHISVYAWIERYVPGGHASPLGILLDIAYDIEFGLSTHEQSSLNLVYLLPGPTDALSLYGYSDERYHIQGGNERLIHAIANTLPADTIQLNHRLIAIARQRNEVLLTFSVTSATGQVDRKTIRADQVILAMPFSTLRQVDYRFAGFDHLKQRAIQQLGYGTNAKLKLQFNQRIWNQSGPWGISNGNSLADTGYQNSWDATRAQPGAAGILVDYFGSAGAAIKPDQGDDSYSATSPAVRAYAANFLHQLEPVFPGLTKHYLGVAALHSPKDDPNLRGSYACWKVGQYTAFSGYEGVRQGPIHFAGEHCSVNFQGYMEGGAAEGERAANEIITDFQAGRYR